MRQPHCRNARRIGHAFAQHQIVQHGGIIDRRKHELDPRHRARIGQPPARRVEHRNNRQHYRGTGEIERRWLQPGHGVHQGGAVFVLHALGVAGGAGGVADHAGIVFRSADPFEVAILRPDPILKRRGVIAAIVAYVMFNHRPARFHPVNNRLEGRIVTQHTVFGVVDDIFELIVKQPRVHCVQHPAHACDAIPADQMARMVHREARDLVARFEAKRLQRLRHLQRIAADTGPIGAGDAAVGPAGNDFARWCFTGGVIDHRRHPHRPVLHCPKP